MASPFTIFRKHRKAFIVALTIMTMFGFVFIPMILDNWQGGEAADPVMVTTKKYGKLTESQVNRLVRQRSTLLVIFESAAMQMSRLQTNDERLARYVRQVVTRQFGPATQEAVVDTWLLSRRAEDLGVQVSNDTVNEFLKQFPQDALLKQLARQKLQDTDWEKLVARHGLGSKQFFALVRGELAAQRLRQLFGPSVGGATPAQRWDYFTRLNREATIEALPVYVSEYVGDVEKPDEKTLRAFFEEHKNDYNLSTSPTPGFRQPERVNVRYFRLASDQIAKSISTKDIQEYIEKNKTELERKYEAAHKKDEKPEEKKTEDKKTEDKKTEEGKIEEKKIEEEKPKEGKKEEEKTEAKTAVEEKKTEGEEKAEPKEGAKEPESEETSSLPGRFPAEFASLLQEGGEGEKTAKKTDEETAEMPDEKAAEKPEEKPGEKPPAEPEDKPPAKPAEKPAEKSDAPPPAKEEGEPDAEKPAAKEKPGETKKPDIVLEPTPEVILPTKAQWIEGRARKDLIERQYGDAIKAFQTAIKNWGKEVRDFKAGVRREPPVAPDFRRLAARFGATTDETGLRSVVEMADLDIARSNDGQNAFLALVFANREDPGRTQLSLYEPGMTIYSEAPSFATELPEDTYVFCRTAEEPEKVHTWDEEGTSALAAEKWKQVQARKKALEAANELAEKARASDESLKAVFPDEKDKIVSAGPFSWMTRGKPRLLVPSDEPARMSKPAGIERPGDDFMRTVFGLSPGGVGVAMNAPESIAYVIRLKSIGPDDYKLWGDFETTQPREYGDLVQGDAQGMFTAWVQQVRAEAGLKWEVAPDQPGRSGGGER